MTRKEKLNLTQLKHLLLNNQLTSDGKKDLIVCIETLRKTLHTAEKSAEKLQRQLNKQNKTINEVVDYCTSQINYCKDLTGFDCCVEELKKVLQILEGADK